MIASLANQSRQICTSQTQETEVELTIKGEKYQFIVSRNSNDYEAVREKIRTQIDKRFNGWSNEHDRQFDESAVFFLLKDMNGNLCAGIRMVVSQSGDSVVPVSQSSRGCEIAFDGSLEYSGLWFDQLRHCKALAGIVGHWVDVNFGDRDIYSIFEASNRAIRRIYLRSFGFDEVVHPAIVYDGFSYRDSGEVVEWQLAVCRHQSRLERSNALLKSVGVTVDRQHGLCHLGITRSNPATTTGAVL